MKLKKLLVAAALGAFFIGCVPNNDVTGTENSSSDDRWSTAKSSSSEYVVPENVTLKEYTPINFVRNQPSIVRTSGYQILVKKSINGQLQPEEAYKIKSICWSPTKKGQRGDLGHYPQHYVQHAAIDIPLIHTMNANTVRTYDPFEKSEEGLKVLDELYSRGIMVIMQLDGYYESFTNKRYIEYVEFFKNHPAILMWQVGNEFEKNLLYSNGVWNLDQCIQAINTAIDEIKRLDPNHPVSVGYAEGFITEHNRFPNVDVWALNIYRGSGLGGVFDQWKSLNMNKPLHIAEYGVDAYNSKIKQEDQNAHAAGVELQTNIILNNLSADDPNKVCAGGSLFAFNDEWWKTKNVGDDWANKHNDGGFYNGGVSPDQYANEEWWGVVDIDRNPRKAYFKMQELYGR